MKCNHNQKSWHTELVIFLEYDKDSGSDTCNRTCICIGVDYKGIYLIWKIK